MNYKKLLPILSLFIIFSFSLSFIPAAAAPDYQATFDPSPPAGYVKLIFIHHSTGENWLTDGYGNLGQELAENNYFVSDTNYGWGPDSIGDRTDIPDWEEWFASEQTPTYMDALFNESSQNSYYTRQFDDPGGENQVILFKSCFPNSALEGSPSDSPDPEGWLTVGHAKYVYNEILQYFATRPDKLFIVITAPPLSDSTYAENARAFNQWLYNDWLDENDYTLPNVAVFDFYNVLTDRDAHHRYMDGYIEHSYGMSNTLAYPSGDDHPSEAGSRKATEEFIPLLNVYYHRWAATAPVEPPVPISTEEGNAPDEGVPLPPENAMEIDNFESGVTGWEPFWDAATDTSITCTADQSMSGEGTTSMRIDFSVAAGSWGNCSRFFDITQDWSAGEWVAFDVHAEQTEQAFNFILYGTTSESTTTYSSTFETFSDADGFYPFTILWNDLLRVEWEEDGGTPFDSPEEVAGIGFGFDAPPDSAYAGTIWIDYIHLEKSPEYEEGGEDTGSPGFNIPCIGTLILPFLLAGFALILKRR